MSEDKKLHCFAPELTQELLDRYTALIAAFPAAEREMKDGLEFVLRCVQAWWELPVSQKAAAVEWQVALSNRTVKLPIVPLEDEHIQQLWDVVPWLRECRAYDELFEALPTGTVEQNGRAQIVDQAAHDLRNCAFHLLWHVKELALDREPLSIDKLQSA